MNADDLYFIANKFSGCLMLDGLGNFRLVRTNKDFAFDSSFTPEGVKQDNLSGEFHGSGQTLAQFLLANSSTEEAKVDSIMGVLEGLTKQERIEVLAAALGKVKHAD